MVAENAVERAKSSCEEKRDTIRKLRFCLWEVIVLQALFLCNICVVFRLVVPFGKLLFIHASTNATDDHKYSPLPSADFDSSAVLVSFSAFIFS